MNVQTTINPRVFLFKVFAASVWLVVFDFSSVLHGETTVSNNFIWGAVTNGVRLGVKIHHVRTGREQPPTCVLYMENVSTNFLYIRLPSIEDRYQINVRREDGMSISRTAKPLLTVTRARFTALSPNLPFQVDHFSIRDGFQIRTNGKYVLTVSAQVATSGGGENLWKLWEGKASYFSLPFVTNSFEIINIVKP